MQLTSLTKMELTMDIFIKPDCGICSNDKFIHQSVLKAARFLEGKEYSALENRT